MHSITVDTIAYIDMLLDIAKEGKTVSLKVAGNSMAPFLIDNRDIVYFGRLDRLPMKGDIALFRRKDGNYILHRVCKVTEEGYYLVGDNQNTIDIEGPIAASQICAIIDYVVRKGKTIKSGNFWWWFFRVIWIRIIPYRRYIKRIPWHRA